MCEKMLDALQCDWMEVWRYRRRDKSASAWDDDCDCGRQPFSRHHELCCVTPIYAHLARTWISPQEVVNVMHMEWMESCFPHPTLDNIARALLSSMEIEA